MLRSLRRFTQDHFLLSAASVLLPLLLTIYGSSLGNDFVNLDDNILVTDNRAVSSPSLASYTFIFTTFDPELYIPLTFVSYKIDYLIHQYDPFVFHLTNLLFHVGNSLLVTWIAWTLLRGKKWTATDRSRPTWPALLVGVLFAIHPLNTESVVWISARKDVLSAFFGLLSWAFYLRDREDPKQRSRWLSVLFFALGLLSKVSIAPLPIILLLCDWKEKSLDRSALKRIAPYLLLSVIFIIVALIGKQTNLSAASSAHAFLLAPFSAVFYLHKLLLPTNLSVLYPYTKPLTFLSPDVLLPLGLMIFLVAMAIATLRRTREIAFGAALFLILLAPSFLNALRGGDFYFASDRYAYLPSIGMFFLLAMLIQWIMERKPSANQILIPAIIILTIGLGFLAHRQSAIWKNSRTLFEHALKLYPNAQVAYVKVGGELMDEGKTEEARHYFQQSIEIRRNERALYNLALLEMEAGRNDEALRLNEEAIALNPHYAYAYVNAGYLRNLRGERSIAIHYFEKAVEFDPFGLEQKINLAALLIQNGETARARELVESVLSLDPENADANILLRRIKQ